MKKSLDQVRILDFQQTNVETCIKDQFLKTITNVVNAKVEAEAKAEAQRKARVEDAQSFVTYAFASAEANAEFQKKTGREAAESFVRGSAGALTFSRNARARAEKLVAMQNYLEATKKYFEGINEEQIKLTDSVRDSAISLSTILVSSQSLWSDQWVQCQVLLLIESLRRCQCREKLLQQKFGDKYPTIECVLLSVWREVTHDNPRPHT